jgi:hypothetical protein
MEHRPSEQRKHCHTQGKERENPLCSKKQNQQEKNNQLPGKRKD